MNRGPGSTAPYVIKYAYASTYVWIGQIHALSDGTGPAAPGPASDFTSVEYGARAKGAK